MGRPAGRRSGPGRRRDGPGDSPARAGRGPRILLFGKPPSPGRVKTRLAPLIGSEGASSLYEAFLEDTAATVSAVRGAEPELWLEPRGTDTLPRQGRAPAAEAEGERLGRRLGLPVRWQEGAGLGARLRSAFEDAFGEKCPAALAVGSDHPTLPPARLEEALAALEEAEVVIGPSEDGGYYLLGLQRSVWPRAAALFEEIPWSTPAVLERTRRRIVSLGLSARELPPWYDVDEPEDVGRLREDLDPASRTAAVLARLLSEARGERGRAGASRPPSRA